MKLVYAKLQSLGHSFCSGFARNVISTMFTAAPPVFVISFSCSFRPAYGMGGRQREREKEREKRERERKRERAREREDER